MSGGIIYGNQESGVTPDLENKEGSLYISECSSARYGDGSNISHNPCKQYDMTYHTIIGRE